MKFATWPVVRFQIEALQPHESIRCGTVCSRIVHSVRIGPPQLRLIAAQLFPCAPQASELIKNAHCTLLSGRGRGFESRRSPNFLESQFDLRQATLELTMLTFRIALISRTGGWPNRRLYSRVNW